MPDSKVASLQLWGGGGVPPVALCIDQPVDALLADAEGHSQLQCGMQPGSHQSLDVEGQVQGTWAPHVGLQLHQPAGQGDSQLWSFKGSEKTKSRRQWLRVVQRDQPAGPVAQCVDDIASCMLDAKGQIGIQWGACRSEMHQGSMGDEWPYTLWT